ncbi:MAG TPA: GTP 3',8-cyclase MoaA, partial [Actinomycetes bacterium]|nr:GTP 3',8-cyclase MoaA [Actinomycetes bacterium]
TLTRRDRLSAVLAGIEAAKDAGLAPVKVNTVLMRDVNDDEVVSLVTWAIANDLQLRFIEQMPLDAQHAWSRTEMIEAGEILERLGEAFTLTPASEPRGSDPAERWVVEAPDGLMGQVGVIGSVTRPFCAACDRVRLTSDGQLRNCLFARDESDLRGAMRAGASDDELIDLMRACLAAKKAGHGIDEPTFVPPPRPMSAIGG